jgi:hypothetical protein
MATSFDLFTDAMSAVLGVFGLFSPNFLNTNFILAEDIDWVAAHRVSRCGGPSVPTRRLVTESITTTLKSASYSLTLPEVEACRVRPPARIKDRKATNDREDLEWEINNCFLDEPNAIACLRSQPACGTVSAPGSPGMSGIFPADCSMGDSHAESGSGVDLRRPDPKDVVVLLGRSGRVIGTGMRISESKILTAYHVAIVEDGYPEAAVFNYFSGHSGQPPSVSARKEVAVLRFDKCTGIGSPDRESEWETINRDCTTAKGLEPQNEFLDYALLEISCEGRRCSPDLAPLFDALPEVKVLANERVHILGFTDNVFFPRGMILSTHGEIVQTSKFPCAAEKICYNNHTNFGFSGGPVFNDRFEWIGIHTKGLAWDCPELSCNGPDFTRPNQGTALPAIKANLKKKLK